MATAEKTEKEPTIKELEAQIADLKKDFVNVADTLRKMASGELNAATDSVRQRAENVAERARSAAHSAKEQVNDATEAARETIARNPLSAAGIALAVGFAIGLLARR